jgi:CBS domain-containing protein
MTNAIAERIALFLNKFHPFSDIPYPELLNLSLNCSVLYLDKNETLFKLNQEVGSNFYVVATGVIGLSLTSDADEILIDKCFEGSTIGLRPYFAKENYLLNAKAREDAIVYALPLELFNSIAINNKFLLNYLLQSFASNTRNPLDKFNRGKLLSQNVINDDQSTEIEHFKPIKYTQNPITASPSDLVKYVAQTMSSSKIDSIIIQENKLPVGIITDKDLRSKIASGLYSIDVSVENIMSKAVITVPENLSIAEAQIIMLKHDVSHLCVTKDGTIHSEISGIISEHDLVVAQSNNAGILLKEIKRAVNAEELKVIRGKILEITQNSIDKNIPINHIFSIVSELNYAISYRVLELAISKMATPPPSKFAWINIGSQGRKEQLLLTDQDNALIFEDVNEEKYQQVQEYFLSLADFITRLLNEIGYRLCKDEMMANNPTWCKSVSKWNSQFTEWINFPGEKRVSINSIFFDYTFIYGEQDLVDQITESIFKNSNDNQIFYAFLGANIIKSPHPIGFFKQFQVEEDGEHKNLFDIKNRAINPLIDAARLLVLSFGIRNINNTHARFLKLAEMDAKNAGTYEACADSFLILTKFRTENGLTNNNNGQFLNLNELSKLEKLKLKNSFEPIDEIQDLLKNKFQLTYFS